ncbi:MFS transporter [Herbaspirillum sp. SJZ107]|uniref:MFS transporter n=1 Tax=Herbaspirillum sp. SJZ107 TaxID=2572881 RepID=UPI00114F0D34|nr:MFS transporter [Herbaspirillum sp. SJZ107]TQK01275.1 hypothetical protein FBX97_5804 [Herbaspirillum sp. SJZ107]
MQVFKHASAAVDDPAPLTKIVVAIHGIGKQHRSETIRSVARRFGDRAEPAIPVLPLGYFSVVEGSKVRWSRLETDDETLADIGFAEVFWADIPDELVRADDTLEETKAWAATLVSRADAIYEKQVRRQPAGRALESEDFRQAADAIDTIIDGIGVIEGLGRVAGKVGLPSFEVGQLLRDYAGDVQTVTEFPHYRNKILYRFHAALNGIVDAFNQEFKRPPEIHLVAHSEGTVISLLALLQALSDMPIDDPAGQGVAQPGHWVQNVRGLMTLGSPIDKHIALWPGLWREFAFTTTIDQGVLVQPARPGAHAVLLKQQIKWRNYFDYGDPVGFRLDEARRTLVDDMGCAAFEFDTADHDFGFSRYWLPGKAHVDYWRDPDLFRHFIDTVVKTPADASVKPPPNRFLPHHVAKGMPYLLAYAIHCGAVVMLLRALVAPGSAPGLLATVAAVGILGTLLAALTVVARLPRLTRPAPRWALLAALCLVAALAALRWLPAPFAQAAGNAVAALWPDTTLDQAQAGRYLVGGLAAAVGAAAWLLPRRAGLRNRKPLVIVTSALVAAAALLARGSVEGIGLTQGAALAAFALLWAFGIILFDLAFVWHRYIRQAVCVRTLRAWRRHTDPEPDPYLGLGKSTLQAQIDARQQR